LFTLIVKLSIRDNVHYRVPEILPAILKWARQRATRITLADWMFGCSKEFVVSRGDTFIGVFVTCHKFSVKHRVYFYIIIFG